MGSPPGPADHVETVAAFQGEHSIDHQPYTDAVGLIEAIGDEEWRASSADRSSASGMDMGDSMGQG